MSVPQLSIEPLRNALARFSAQPVQRKVITTAVLAIVLSSITWCIRDYRDWLTLGPGGLPYNIVGWLIVTLFIRPIAMSKSGALSTADYPDHGAHDEVQALPHRKGERAVAKGLVPHRQMTQNAPKAMRPKLEALFDSAVERYPSLLHKAKSLWEKHNDALYVNESLLAPEKGSAPQTARICRGEISHIHGDLSTHMVMSPADAKLAIEKGWGERHLMARPKPLFGKYLFRIVPSYVMIYGPRDDEELQVFAKLLQSSVRFNAGREDITLIAQ